MSATTVITRVGNRVIEWDCGALELLLAELRDKRLQHDIDTEVESAEAQHNALMAQADAIKQRATNALREARAT